MLQKYLLEIYSNNVEMVMNKELLHRIKVLCEIGQLNELETAERLLDTHLELHPQDTQAWLRLFMVVIADILDDEEKAIDCCKKILAYDPYSLEALLALFYMYLYHAYFRYSGMLDALFTFQSDNYEHMSLIEYARALYYEDKEEALLKEKALLRSISYCPQFVCHYRRLGSLYIWQNRFQEA